MIRKTDFIRDKLLADLLEHGLKPGDPIPSRHQLCRKFNCSRTTVERAIGELTASGYLCSRQGAGTFVNQPHPVKGIHTLYVAAENLQKEPDTNTLLREMLFPDIKPGFEIVGVSVTDLSAHFSKICLPGSAVLWFMPSMSCIQLMDYLESANVPQFLINRKYKNFNYAVTDARNSIKEGLSWLMIEGGRDITLIAQEADTMHPYQYDRILAFFQAAVELGARLSPDSIHIRNFKDVPEEIAEIANQIFHTPSPARAVFILDSKLTVPFVTAARSIHFALGRDYSLLNFDCEESLAGHPGAAMLSQQWKQLYYEALRWVSDGYAEKRKPFYSNIKTRLILPR